VTPTSVATATQIPEPTATKPPPTATPTATQTATPTATPTPTFPSHDPYPIQIEVMRQQSYPGSEITIEQTLSPGANYKRYIVSYLSDGLKIYALMTVPDGQKPATGWPVIIFNHGFIPPAQYRTTERYVAYVDAIARSGYIVFKSDYRGHGSSEGVAEGGYGFPGYTDDVLNALASMKMYRDADPDRIGMWGHSMGGQLTLRAMVISKDIKAGVIWSGVVAPYPDVFARAKHPGPTRVPLPTEAAPGDIGPYGRRWRQALIDKYGTPEQNPGFWASISPNSYLADISGPLQLHASLTDEEVPVEASQTLYAEMQAAGKPVELYTYPNDNHNISGHFSLAMQRTIAFFDKYVKGS
jgi:dipeptidyl aminopeptidase/acylaminoacyl peptidase